MRAVRFGRQLSLKQDNTYLINDNDILAFITLHNERRRLPYFLEYYRKMGVNHFFFIDNNSDDGTAEYLAQFSDVTRYFTKHSYRRSHFGMDWINRLLFKHARGKWALTVDVDEFLVYPHHEKRPLHALTDWLDASSINYLPAQLLDLYPNRKLSDEEFDENTNPFDLLTHFDVGNYSYKRNSRFKNLWIQGGVRARLFFKNKLDQAPALNKTPLVRWKKGYVYTSSTHTLLPKRLNEAHLISGAERICGVLLHTKFLPDLQNKVKDPYLMEQHYSRAREYQSYNQAQLDDLNFTSELSTRYLNWHQLEMLGIISRGGWA